MAEKQLTDGDMLRFWSTKYRDQFDLDEIAQEAYNSAYEKVSVAAQTTPDLSLEVEVEVPEGLPADMARDVRGRVIKLFRDESIWAGCRYTEGSDDDYPPMKITIDWSEGVLD